MKCSQCSGSGMVQTGSFGPKPCPNCGGRGFVDGEEKSGGYKTMGYGEIIFYSLLGAGAGFLIWEPLVIFLPFIIFVYLQGKYQ